MPLSTFVYIHIYMRKHSQHNKDNRTLFFRKIHLSHFIRNGYERVTVGLLCGRWVGDWTKIGIYWPPALPAVAALLSRSAGLLNRGPGGPASAGTWFSFLELQQLTSNSVCKLWLPVAPGLYHCLTPTCFLWRHNSHSIQLVDSQGYPLISSTGCTCYLLRCISHLTAWPGRRSICYTLSRTGNTC